MAYDIGPKLGIDGYAEFRKAITDINDDVKMFGSELKLIAAIYDENGDSMEALSAKNEVLEKTYEAQEKKVAEVSKVLERARAEYGDNETAVKKWEQVLIESQTALQKTQNEIKKNQQAMEQLENASGEVEEAFDGIRDSAKDAGKAVENIGDAAKESSGKFDALKEATGNLISGGISAVVDGVAEAIGAFVNLDESTEDYRVAMGKLKTAFTEQQETVENASVAHGEFTAVLYDTDTALTDTWRTAETASEVYTKLYGILGDTDTAVEAAQLMVQMAESEENFTEWTRIAAGVAGTFGDALPINSLVEAANETVKVGEVTGALADALNWVGISEDDFNAKLAECTTESERNDLIMQTLTSTYSDAADAFYENNEALIQSRENQAKLDEVTGRLGESVSDIKNALLEKFGPAIVDTGDKIADFIEGVDTDKLFAKFDGAIENIKNAFDEGWDEIKKIYDIAPSFFDELGDEVGHSFDLVKNLWEGDFDEAWNSVLDIVSDKVAGVVGGALDIKEMFSDLDWSTDFDEAWAGVESIMQTAWETISGIANDIWSAITRGVEDGQETHNRNKANNRNDDGGFGDDEERSGSSGGSGGSGDSGSGGGGRAEPAPIIHNAIYLDGKRVGAILNSVNDASRIASGADISLLT